MEEFAFNLPSDVRMRALDGDVEEFEVCVNCGGQGTPGKETIAKPSGHFAE